MSTARRRTLRAGAALTGLALALGLAACQSAEEPSASESPSTPAATDDATGPSEEPTDGPTADPATEEPDDATTAPDDGGLPDGAAVNGPNAIVAPLDGETVPGPTLTVRGRGTAYEGTLNYEVVVPETDEVVAADYTQAGANGEVGPFEFTVDLAPGTYVVRVFEPEISDTEPGDGGAYVNLVEVTVTVE